MPSARLCRRRSGEGGVKGIFAVQPRSSFWGKDLSADGVYARHVEYAERRENAETSARDRGVCFVVLIKMPREGHTVRVRPFLFLLKEAADI